MITNHRLDSKLVSSVHNTEFVKFHKAHGRNVVHRAFNAVSNDNNRFLFEVFPSGSDMILDQAMFVKYTVAFTSNGADYNNSLQRGCLRAFPLNSVINNLSVNINGQNLSNQPARLVHCLDRFHDTPHYRMKFHGSFPSSLDTVSEYARVPPFHMTTNVTLEANGPLPAEGGNGVAVGGSFSYFPVATSPFCWEDWHGKGEEKPRNSYAYSEGGLGTGARTYTVCEPLLHPLLSDRLGHEGLSNVNSMKIEMTFNSLVRMYSSMNTIGQFTAAFSGTPQLLVNMVSPTEPQKIPTELHLPIKHYEVRQAASTGQITLGNSTTLNLNNVVFSQVPSKMFIFARRADADLTEKIADGFGTLSNLSLTMKDKQGLFSGVDQFALYNMSVKNGLNLSWSDWSRRLGSIIAIDTADDIGGFIPNSLTNFNVDLQVTVTNTQCNTEGDQLLPGGGGNGITYSVFLIAEFDGIFTISPDVARLQLGLSESEVISAIDSPSIAEGHDHPESESIGAGGKISFGRWLKRGKQGLDTASKYSATLQNSGLVDPHSRIGQALTNLQTANMVVNKGGATQGAGLVYG